MVKQRRLQPVKGGFFVMEQQKDGSWIKVDFCEREIDAQRQYQGIEVRPAKPREPRSKES